MAKVIAHRDLRNRSSEVLRDVQRGETYEITNHGEVVAVLMPTARAAGGTLRTRPARRSGGFTAPQRAPLSHPVQESLDELRGER